jgi:uncharacterized protein (DUF433 family)
VAEGGESPDYATATMTAHDRIEINPKIMLPVIRGTRIPVELIVRKMAEGADEKAVLQAYPTLTSKDVHAALRYAADSLGQLGRQVN